MITYDQFKELAESFRYRLKKYIWSNGEIDYYIDISNSEDAPSELSGLSGLIVMLWKTNKTVSHWTTDKSGYIGPHYDENIYIKKINTYDNEYFEGLSDIGECKKILFKFTENWKLLKKYVRKRKIEEL